MQDETHLVFRGRGSLDCCTVAGQATWVSGADDGALSLWGTMKKKPLMVAQVRFCRYRVSPAGELKYRGARRVRAQVHCIKRTLLLFIRLYC